MLKRALRVGLDLFAFSVLLIPVIRAAQASKAANEQTEALRVVDAWLDSLQVYRQIPAVSAGVAMPRGK